MSSPYLSMNHTLPSVTEILAHLFAQDDAVLTIKLLSFLHEMAQSTAPSEVERKSATVAITKTISSLTSDEEYDGTLNAASVVLVAAAKHGCSSIVEAVLANNYDNPEFFSAKTNTNEAHAHIATLINTEPVDGDQISAKSVTNILVRAAKKSCSDTSKNVFVNNATNIRLSVIVRARNFAEHHSHARIVECLNQFVDFNQSLGEQLPEFDTSSHSPESDTDTHMVTLSSPLQNSSPPTNGFVVKTVTNNDFQQYDKIVDKFGDVGDLDALDLLELVDPRKRSSTQDIAALQYASYSGDISTAQRLLADPNIDPTDDEDAVIRLASLMGRTDILELLLADSRVNPAASSDSPIRFASENGHTDAMKLLLADPRVNPAACNDAAIGGASIDGHLEAVKLLLSDSRVNPEADDDYALQHASKNGHVDIVSLLLADVRVNPASNNNFSICMASENGFDEIVKLLMLDSRVNPAADDNYGIQNASANGYDATVSLLLSDARVNPASNNNSAIKCASKNGHAKVVKLLLADPRVNPAASNNYAIQTASQFGHADTVKLLLADGRINPAARNNFAVQQATANGKPETMRALLEDPRVNFTEQQRPDVIRAAVMSGFVDVVAILLTRFQFNGTIITELIGICAEFGRSEILKLLLHQRETDDALFVPEINTLVQSARKGGHYQVVLAFLELPAESKVGKGVVNAFTGAFLLNDKLLGQLACMHVDVLRIILCKFESSLNENVSGNLMNTAFSIGSPDVVEELIEHHQEHFGDWSMDDFDIAALHGNVPVLKLLSSSRFDGFTRLVETPPLNRICTRKVLGDMCRASAVALMFCVKKKTTARRMAKLLDVLRDLASEFLQCEMK